MPVQIVSFHCVLKNKLGHVLGTSYNRDVVISNHASEQHLKGLIEGMQDLSAGEKRMVILPAELAYGYYDPKLIIKREIDQLNITKPLSVGENIIYNLQGQNRYFRVTSTTEEYVTLDGNHPLAGQDLIFEIEATDARDATLEDLGDQKFNTKYQ